MGSYARRLSALLSYRKANRRVQVEVRVDMSLETIGIFMMILGAATICAVISLYIAEHIEFE